VSSDEWTYMICPRGDGWQVEVYRDGVTRARKMTFTKSGARRKARRIKKRIERGTWPRRRIERGVL